MTRRPTYTAARLTSIPAPAPATTAQPVSQLGEAIRAACGGILSGAIQPCPVCGRFDCDHDEWPELMHTDPIDNELRH